MATYRLKCEANTFHKDREEWETYRMVYDVRAVSRTHAINKGLAKVETNFPNHEEYSAEIIEGYGQANNWLVSKRPGLKSK